MKKSWKASNLNIWVILHILNNVNIKAVCMFLFHPKSMPTNKFVLFICLFGVFFLKRNHNKLLLWKLHWLQLSDSAIQYLNLTIIHWISPGWNMLLLAFWVNAFNVWRLKAMWSVIWNVSYVELRILESNVSHVGGKNIWLIWCPLHRLLNLSRSTWICH